MNDDQIKYMVSRFLAWRLPENFNPDGGISFKRTFNEHTSHPMKHEPVGTNLFDHTQAEQMIRYLIDGVESGAAQEVSPPSPVPKELRGAWPEKCLQRAFVEGAAWWEWSKEQATMWQGDRKLVEAAAVKLYGEPTEEGE